MDVQISDLSELEQRRRTMPAVFVIDDDIATRESLQPWLHAAGWWPRMCASAEELLAQPRSELPSCLVLDLDLPGLAGLELQHRLALERPDLPIVFTTRRGDVPTTVQAMKGGAFEVLTKPLAESIVVAAIAGALERSRAVLRAASEMRPLRDRYAALTPREQEVMALVITGLLNKQIGGELGISEITVKAHRGSMMRKMAASSLPELVTIAAHLGLERSDKSRSRTSAPALRSPPPALASRWRSVVEDALSTGGVLGILAGQHAPAG